mgnify:CR=1 FL=1
MAQPARPELWRDVCKTNWHPAQLSSLTVHSSQVLLLSGAPAPAFLFPDTTNIFAELRSFAPRVLCSLLPAKCLAVHSTHIQVIDTGLTCKHVQLCTLCLGYKCNKLDLLDFDSHLKGIEMCHSSMACYEIVWDVLVPQVSSVYTRVHNVWSPLVCME